MIWVAKVVVLGAAGMTITFIKFEVQSALIDMTSMSGGDSTVFRALPLAFITTNSGFLNYDSYALYLLIKIPYLKNQNIKSNFKKYFTSFKNILISD